MSHPDPTKEYEPEYEPQETKVFCKNCINCELDVKFPSLSKCTYNPHINPVDGSTRNWNCMVRNSECKCAYYIERE